MVLNGISVTPTGTYPYTSIGPVDYSNLNFVKTKQTDYYYGAYASGSPAVLLSQVEQTYDPTTAFLVVAALGLGFLTLLWFVIKRMMRF